MKIAILLPYKEDYTSKYSGAVSIHVSNLYKCETLILRSCYSIKDVSNLYSFIR